MYADILKSRRTLGWRTCVIIPELEREVQAAKTHEDLAAQIRNLRRLQYDLDEYIDVLRLRVPADASMESQFLEAEAKSAELKQTLYKLALEYDSYFNGNWGQMFKAGYQDSRFARQVLNYACLYTSKASNFASISPRRSFRPVQDFMAHDQVLFDSEEVFTFAKASELDLS